MEYGHPERLLNREYLTAESPFAIFRHEVSSPIPVHWHEFYELGLVVEGSGIHRINGRPRAFERGTIFLLTPADFHEIFPDSGETIRLFDVIFTESFFRQGFDRWFLQEVSQTAAQLDEDNCRLFEQEFTRLWVEKNGQQASGSSFILQGTLERILIDLTRLRPREASSQELTANRIHPSVRQAITYIQHHFREPLTLEMAAAQAGLSANYFSECFNKDVGTSFQTYILERRLEFARSLLYTTALSVTEISFASGFGTLNHFERMFKKKYGHTPRESRRKQLTATKP